MQTVIMSAIASPHFKSRSDIPVSLLRAQDIENRIVSAMKAGQNGQGVARLSEIISTFIPVLAIDMPILGEPSVAQEVLLVLQTDETLGLLMSKCFLKDDPRHILTVVEGCANTFRALVAFIPDEELCLLFCALNIHIMIGAAVMSLNGLYQYVLILVFLNLIEVSFSPGALVPISTPNVPFALRSNCLNHDYHANGSGQYGLRDMLRTPFVQHDFKPYKLYHGSSYCEYNVAKTTLLEKKSTYVAYVSEKKSTDIFKSSRRALSMLERCIVSSGFATLNNIMRKRG
ncbi:hypothetical protein C8J56DRAFT_1068474 [Mycena floridula]|nr:hypothetical protein C8J56DRAFT_1068474 [Mycena floridula]